jgi:hypothetical protein
VSGAGLATIVSQNLLWLVGSALPERSRPADSVILKSSKIELVLDRKHGLPFEYRVLLNVCDSEVKISAMHPL